MPVSIMPVSGIDLSVANCKCTLLCCRVSVIGARVHVCVCVYACVSGGVFACSGGRLISIVSSPRPLLLSRTQLLHSRSCVRMIFTALATIASVLG